MLLVDWIAIGLMVFSLLIGSLVGFGKLLKFLTGGLVGIIISFVVTYFCLGVVASWGFVQDLLAKLVGSMASSNSGFVKFLLNIHIEKVLLAVILFIVVQILRIIIVNIIKGIAEIDNPVMKLFNRFFGVVLLAAVICMVGLIAFHIIDWIGGGTRENVVNSISGSKLKLDWVFEHNPLRYIIKKIIPA